MTRSEIPRHFPTFVTWFRSHSPAGPDRCDPWRGDRVGHRAPRPPRTKAAEVGDRARGRAAARVRLRDHTRPRSSDAYRPRPGVPAGGGQVGRFVDQSARGGQRPGVADRRAARSGCGDAGSQSGRPRPSASRSARVRGECGDRRSPCGGHEKRQRWIIVDPVRWARDDARTWNG
jgi:hypothetical protein